MIKDMTSAELYALDFAKMSAGERAAFRDELDEKPGYGPLAPAAEHRIYAEAHARWSDWVKDHPEDDVPPARGVAQSETGQRQQSGAPTPPAPPQPRPDGTAPRRQPPQGTGL